MWARAREQQAAEKAAAEREDKIQRMAEMIYAAVYAQHLSAACCPHARAHSFASVKAGEWARRVRAVDPYELTLPEFKS